MQSRHLTVHAPEGQLDAYSGQYTETYEPIPSSFFPELRAKEYRIGVITDAVRNCVVIFRQAIGEWRDEERPTDVVVDDGSDGGTIVGAWSSDAVRYKDGRRVATFSTQLPWLSVQPKVEELPVFVVALSVRPTDPDDSMGQHKAGIGRKAAKAKGRDPGKHKRQFEIAKGYKEWKMVQPNGTYEEYKSVKRIPEKTDFIKAAVDNYRQNQKRRKKPVK